MKQKISKKSTQANDIILKEHDIVITDKKQIAELFNSYFVNIADGVPEITEQIYEKGFDLPKPHICYI